MGECYIKEQTSRVGGLLHRPLIKPVSLFQAQYIISYNIISYTMPLAAGPNSQWEARRTAPKDSPPQFRVRVRLGLGSG